MGLPRKSNWRTTSELMALWTETAITKAMDSQVWKSNRITMSGRAAVVGPYPVLSSSIAILSARAAPLMPWHRGVWRQELRVSGYDFCLRDAFFLLQASRRVVSTGDMADIGCARGICRILVGFDGDLG